MKTTNRARIGRKRLVILNEAEDRGRLFIEQRLAEGFHEVSARITEFLGLDEHHIGDIKTFEYQASTFPRLVSESSFTPVILRRN